VFATLFGSLMSSSASAQICNKIKQGFGSCVFCNQSLQQSYQADSSGCYACLGVCRLLSPVEPDPVTAASALGLTAASDGQVLTLAVPSALPVAASAPQVFDGETLMAIAKTNAYAAFILSKFNPGASAQLDLAQGEGFITNAPTVETLKLLTSGATVDAAQHTLVPVANGNIVRVAWNVTKKGGGRASGTVTTMLHDANGNVLSEAAPTIFLEFGGDKNLRLLTWEADGPTNRAPPAAK